MTSPSAIFFSFVRLCVILSCTQLSAASLGGNIQLMASKNSSVSKHQDFSGVVVWLTSRNAPADPKPSRQHYQMLQKDKTFSPHILAIPTGAFVDFPNLDPIFHNAFSNFDGKIFDVSLYPPGSSRTVHFDRPGIVRIFCNIHPSMSAIIVVLDSNHFAITDRHGDFQLTGITPGDYDIHFFHERSTPETLQELTRPLTITSAGLALPALAISEAGYIPVAHKNKYGREYPPQSENAASYPLPVR